MDTTRRPKRGRCRYCGDFRAQETVNIHGVGKIKIVICPTCRAE